MGEPARTREEWQVECDFHRTDTWQPHGYAHTRERDGIARLQDERGLDPDSAWRLVRRVWRLEREEVVDE